MLNQFRRTIKEKGQGLTEYVLILAFIAGVAFMMFGGSGSLKGTLVDTVTKTNNLLAGLFDDGIKYADALKKYGSMARRDLVQVIKNSNGTFKLGEDIISNEERLAADRAALSNIADLFLDMSYSDLKKLMGGGFSEDFYLNPNANDNTKKGILILNYVDRSYVERNYVEGSGYTGNQFTQGEDTYITFGEGNNPLPVDGHLRQGFTNQEVIHWMQGDYGNRKDSSGQYNSNLDFNPNTRYFYSNDALDPSSDLNRNVRVRFTITGADNSKTGGTDERKVTGVQVRLQKAGKNIEGAVVEKGNFVKYGI